MRKLTLLCCLLCGLYACQQNNQSSNPISSSAMSTIPKLPSFKTTSKDLADIKKNGKLRALTVYSGTSYFLYRGQAMGFEYELLQKLADHLGLELEIKVATDLDMLIPMLNEGEADIIAHGITITQDRKQKVAFTDHLYLTNQVLVQRKPDNWRKMKLHQIEKMLVADPIELINDTVSVRKNSSYYKRLKNIEKELGGQFVIDTIDGRLPTDKIIEMVVSKELKYTVADKNLATINASHFPILNIETPMSSKQRVAWAIHKDAKDLHAAVNDWLDQFKGEIEFPVIYNKYFKNKRSFNERIDSEFYSQNSSKISPYDELIRQYAPTVGWDWRMIAAIIYQESQFDPTSKSWVNASGLMQLMPATATELGVKNIADPQQNIQGGTKYLKQLWDQLDMIPDSIQRIKFTLASYNCGLGHVQDAMRLTEASGGQKTVWDGEVEKHLLNLTYPEYYNKPIIKYGYVRGTEPVEYVHQIFNHFSHYEELIPL